MGIKSRWHDGTMGKFVASLCFLELTQYERSIELCGGFRSAGTLVVVVCKPASGDR
jgi:hypothetical protein